MGLLSDTQPGKWLRRTALTAAYDDLAQHLPRNLVQAMQVLDVERAGSKQLHKYGRADRAVDSIIGDLFYMTHCA